MQHRRENDCYLVVSSTSVVLFYFLDLTWLQPGPILRLAALWTVLLSVTKSATAYWCVHSRSC